MGDDFSLFPDPKKARRDGLIATGGDLSIPRLLLAYRSGIFPWTADPITWWSPNPRAIFNLSDFHIPRSLARTLRRGDFRVTFDEAFSEVIRNCRLIHSQKQESWIAPGFVTAYTELHRAGHAHSVECWKGDRLVGGVYGVAVGGLFAGESMFHNETDASKVALVHLFKHLRRLGYVLFDTQMLTPVTKSLGAIEVTRDDYLKRLAKAIAIQTRPFLKVSTTD